MKTNLDLQSQLSQLNELITIKDDLSDQIQQLGNFIDELQDQKKSMQRELDTAGDYLLEQEEKTNRANLSSLQLIEKLKECE